MGGGRAWPQARQQGAATFNMQIMMQRVASGLPAYYLLDGSGSSPGWFLRGMYVPYHWRARFGELKAIVCWRGSAVLFRVVGERGWALGWHHVLYKYQVLYACGALNP
jgi:hypothetical protein